MPLDPQQQQRRDEINAILRDKSGPPPGAERRALARELSEILESDAPPSGPQADERTPVYVGRADRLSHALKGYAWSGTDRALLADAFAEAAEKLPESAWTPPVIVAGASKAALLPAALTQRLSDRDQSPEAREATLADLDRTLLAGLGGGGDAGGGAA